MSGIHSFNADSSEESVRAESSPRCLHDVRIEHLLSRFYGPPSSFEELGSLEAVAEVPAPFDRLLDHNEHMTVTVEAFHGEKVDVRVHRSQLDGPWYAREITLVGTESGNVVQYGIVRLNTQMLSPEVWERIRSQTVPLGRVLIEHQVLREVQLQGLWRVQAGPALASLLEIPVGKVVYGRTALIFCDGEPAIELLEIVRDR